MSSTSINNIEKFSEASTSLLDPRERYQTLVDDDEEVISPPRRPQTKKEISVSTFPVVVPRSSNPPSSPQTQQTSSSCCDSKPIRALKRFRFEIIVLFASLMILAAPAYFVVKMLDSSFTFHKECVECLDPGTKSSTARKVFNHTSGQCIPFSSLSSPSQRNDIVFESAFCGAPECQSQILLPGIRPVPYWLIFASCVVGILLSNLVNIVREILMPVKLSCYESLGWELPEPDLVADLAAAVERRPHLLSLRRLHFLFRATRSFGTMDPYYYSLLYTGTLLHFAFIIYEVCSQLQYEHLSGWKRYETIFGLWINSGTTEILCFFWAQSLITIYVGKGAGDLDATTEYLKMSVDQLLRRDRFQSMLVAPLLVIFGDIAFVFHILPLFLLPLLFTHVIPALVIFLPVAILILAPYIIFSGLLGETNIFMPTLDTPDWKIYGMLFWLRLLGTLTLICFFQTFSNYSIMFYSGEYSWPEVIKFEFMHRSTVCYANAFVNNLQVYNVGLAGLIFA